MPAEQRGQVIHVRMGSTGNRRNSCLGGSPVGLPWGGTSRMRREFHVRICEGLRVKFPGPTRRTTSVVSLPRSRHNAIGEGEFGNSIRGPLGVHRGAGRRFWFYGADYTLEAQMAYVNRLRKLTEDELRKFIAGKEIPLHQARRPRDLEPSPTVRRAGSEFRILEHVGRVRRVGRNCVARCPSCAEAGHDRSCDNLAILIGDPRFYRCWAGCSKEMIRAALGCPIRSRSREFEWSCAVTQNQQANAMGLRLPRRALRVLRERGIFAQASIGLHYQNLAKRYVVRGVESGGAAADVGRYVTFAHENGEPIECLHPVESIGVNGPHAVVVAPVLVRLDMLRKGRTYELLISRHAPSSADSGRRPLLQTEVLFRGVHGRLEADLTPTNKAQAQSSPT